MGDAIGAKEFIALNTMLAKIGQVPMENAEDSEGVDPQMAKNTLDRVNAAVQAEGWYFNTERDYVLEPDENGEIILPDDVLRVDVDAVVVRHYHIFPIQRGSKLYDRENHTFQFDTAFPATIIVKLPFEDLPELARQYITLRAAQSFQSEVLGSPTIDQLMTREIEQIRGRLMSENMRINDYNFLSRHEKSLIGRDVPLAGLTRRRLI